MVSKTSVLMDPKPLTTLDKRLVLEYTSGVMKGIFQIFASCEQDAYPKHFKGPFVVCEAGQVVEFASLIRVTPRAVYYREVFDQSHMSGRLDDYFPEGPQASFDPKQV